MPRYETIPPKHAAFYVKQFDRLLNQDKHPLEADQRKKLREIRDMLADKAEQHEKESKKEKGDGGEDDGDQ